MGEGSRNKPGNRMTPETAQSASSLELAQLQKGGERSQALYRTIVDSLREGIWMLDAELHTEYVNKRLCEIIGYEEKEILGRRSTDFTWEDEVADTHAKLRKARSGVGSRYERRYRHKNGSMVWTEVSVNPRFNQDGEYVGSVAVVIDISDRKRAEAQQALQRDVLEQMAAGSPLPETLQIIADGLASTLPGTACSIYALEKGCWNCLAATGYPEALQPETHLAPHDPVSNEAGRLLGEHTWVAMRRAAGAAGFDHLSLTPVREVGGHCLGLIVTHQPCRHDAGDSDIQGQALDNAARYARTAIQDARAEQRLRDKEERFRILVEYSPDAIVVFDGETGQFVDANPNAAELFGYSREALLGMTPWRLSPERQPDGTLSTETGMQQIRAATDGDVPVFEWTHLKADGSVFPAEVRLVRLPDSEGGVLIRGSITDITERWEHERELRYLASHDPLTGLLNRAVFMERLDHAVKIAKRRSYGLTVLFMDLDRFKYINDQLGHAYGDALLMHVADTLCACLRESDTIARPGGDEFTMILEGIQDADDINTVIEKIRRSVSQPLSFEGETLVSVASIGVAVYPRDGVDGESLLKAADAAMYRAKEVGGDGYRMFGDPS